MKVQALQSKFELISDEKLQGILKDYKENPKIVSEGRNFGFTYIDKVTPMVNASVDTTAKLFGMSNDEAKKFLAVSFKKATGKDISEVSEADRNEFYTLICGFCPFGIALYHFR